MPAPNTPTALVDNGITPLLDIEHVGDWLGMTPEAIRTSRSREEEPGTLGFKVGRRLKFDAADVHAFIERRKHASDPA